MQEPMRVIALSALVLPLGFVAQVAHQRHGRLVEAAGSGERSRTSSGVPPPD